LVTISGLFRKFLSLIFDIFMSFTFLMLLIDDINCFCQKTEFCSKSFEF